MPECSVFLPGRGVAAGCPPEKRRLASPQGAEISALGRAEAANAAADDGG